MTFGHCPEGGKANALSSPVAATPQTVELDGTLYEAGAAIISEMNLYFKADLGH